MGKKLDFTRSVHDLVREYPELVDILKGLGFTEITKKGMLQSVGRIMTIPRGAAMKGISMAEVAAALSASGFVLEGAGPAPAAPEKEESGSAPAAADASVERLKGYLKRLRDGEELAQVRKDFAAHFAQVDASEIMEAEQELL